MRPERDELAERLAQIEACQPDITDAAKVWVAQVDRAARDAADGSEWGGRN
jgi:hypothetical protein